VAVLSNMNCKHECFLCYFEINRCPLISIDGKKKREINLNKRNPKLFEMSALLVTNQLRIIHVYLLAITFRDRLMTRR
jgi:hypothetical protein